jgi:BirA family biotin operon repressor/biotin-[acetyl-CoA-carboxylase] ligase
VAEPVRYDDCTADELRQTLGIPCLEVYARLTSTMNTAHALGAAGAPAGTIVLADEQTAGRGRAGRVWRSPPGAGIWLACLERPLDLDVLPVLSLRLGLATARVLDEWSASTVLLKWPNDLYVGARKLAGFLVESRWRGDTIDWIVIGFGLNVRPPAGLPGAAALLPGTARLDVLRRIVPPLRSAAAVSGPLSAPELEQWARRDLAPGRACREPVNGRVRGIDASGALLVDTPGGEVRARAGSLVFSEDP